MSVIKLKIAQIRIDGGTQNRIEINPETVKEYSDSITEGTNFPPVTVFFDGVDYWLADGFHRYHANNNIKALDIDAEVINGTKRDAILHSVGVNATHGLKRTNADKRKSVETLLNDSEWSKWSDREIARKCYVHHETVSGIRKTYLAISPDSKNHQGESPDDKPNVRKVERNGKTYEQDTSNIGKSQPKKQSENKPDLKIVNSDNHNELADDEHKSKEELYGNFDPIAELEEANKEIDRLTKIIESDDQLSEANKEIKRLLAQNETQQYRINSLMSEKAAAIKHAQSYKYQLEKLEKQVKAAGLVDF